MYQQSFPEDDGQLQVHMAIDILLQKESDQAAEAGIACLFRVCFSLIIPYNCIQEMQTGSISLFKWTFGIKSRYLWQHCNVFSLIPPYLHKRVQLSIAAIKRSLLSTLDDKSTLSLKCDSMEGFKDLLFTQSLAEPMAVRCLDGLVRAHVLLAVMSKRTSPEHQLNLLRASAFVLQIWQARPPCVTRSSTVYADLTLIECGGKYSSAQCLSRQVSMATHSHAAVKKGQDSSQKSARGKKVSNVRLHPGNILPWLPCVTWMED